MNLNQPKYDCEQTKAQHQAQLKALEAYEQALAMQAGKFLIFSVVR